MSKDEIKNVINQYLSQAGCTQFLFEEPDENTIIVLFNSKEIISFNSPLQNWVSTGIQLDDSKKRQYKIEFKKTANS